MVLSPIVVDASVFVPLIVPEPGSPGARALMATGAPLLAPSLLLLEVANALLSRHRKGLADPPDLLASALRELRAGAIALTEDSSLVDAAASIARRERHPIYDCLYLALARRADATLATYDRRLMGVAQGLAIPVWTPDPA